MKILKPKDKCPKHKRGGTIWYRETGELICMKCSEVLIKGIKQKR